MDIVLVAGFWLGGWAWDDVRPGLERAGHTVHALTLPGLESLDSPRAAITLTDHVDAIANVVSGLGRCALVAHSGAGTPVHAVVDRWPARVARAVYVDSGPIGDGVSVRDDIAPEQVELPLPPWEEFGGTSLLDGLDQRRLDAFRRRAVPHPAGPARDPQRLSDPRRFDVPVTVITSSYRPEQVRALAAKQMPMFAELARLRQVDYVDLPTGHWPMFSRPVDLTAALLEVVGPA